LKVLIHLGFHEDCAASAGRNFDCYVAGHWNVLNSDAEIETADGIGLGLIVVVLGFVEVENPRVSG
jgi:hypothetical protein